MDITILETDKRDGGMIPLTFDQLYGWTQGQAPGTVVGKTKDPTDCPCQRCMVDLKVDPLEPDELGYKPFFSVVYASTSVMVKRGLGTFELKVFEHPQWLDDAVRGVDRTGDYWAHKKGRYSTAGVGFAVTRENLLQILDRVNAEYACPLYGD